MLIHVSFISQTLNLSPGWAIYRQCVCHCLSAAIEIQVLWTDCMEEPQIPSIGSCLTISIMKMDTHFLHRNAMAWKLHGDVKFCAFLQAKRDVQEGVSENHTGHARLQCRMWSHKSTLTSNYNGTDFSQLPPKKMHLPTSKRNRENPWNLYEILQVMRYKPLRYTNTNPFPRLPRLPKHPTPSQLCRSQWCP